MRFTEDVYSPAGETKTKRFTIACVVCGAVLAAVVHVGGQPNQPPGIDKPALPSLPTPKPPGSGPGWEYNVIPAKDFNLLCAAENGDNDPRNPGLVETRRKQLALDKLGGDGWELAGVEVQKGATSAYIFKRKKAADVGPAPVLPMK